jgi:PST family polysaccharide transporter
MFSAVCQVAAVLVSLPFGLAGVATAHAIVTYALCVPALTYAGKPFGIKAVDVLRAAGPQTAAALIAVAVGIAITEWFLFDVARITRLLAACVVCLCTYLAVVVGIFRVTAPLSLAYSLVRDFGSAQMRRRSTSK